MANKTHRTRQKLVFRVPVSTPRNPLVAAVKTRSSGAHASGGGRKKMAERKNLLNQAFGKEGSE